MRVRCIGPLEYISDTHADTVSFVLQTHFLPLRPALRNPVKNMANDELSHRMPFDGSSNSAMPASLPHTQVPHKTLAEISAAFFFHPKFAMHVVTQYQEISSAGHHQKDDEYISPVAFLPPRDVLERYLPTWCWKLHVLRQS